MSYQPERAAREFHNAYGIMPIDVTGDRAGAVSVVTQRAAGFADEAEQLQSALWSLLTDLEAAASDEGVAFDLDMAAGCVAQMLAVLYELADVLGLRGVLATMAKSHEVRMNAFTSRSPSRPAISAI